MTRAPSPSPAASSGRATSSGRRHWTWSVGAELIATDERDVDLDTGTTRRRTFFIGALPAYLGYDGSNDLLDPTSRLPPVGALLARGVAADREASSTPAPRSTAASTSRSRDTVTIAGRTRLGTIFGAEPRPDRAVAALLCRRRRLGARLRLPGARAARSGVRRSDRRPQPDRIRARGAGPGRQFRHRAVHRRRQHLDLAAAAASTICGSAPASACATTPASARSGSTSARRSIRAAAIRASPSTSRSARPSDDERRGPRSPPSAGRAGRRGAALARAGWSRLAKFVAGIAARPADRVRGAGRLPRHRRRPPLHRRPDRGDDPGIRASHPHRPDRRLDLGRTQLRDVRLYDPDGLFAESPEIEMDWRPHRLPVQPPRHPRARIRPRHPPPPARADPAARAAADPARLRHPRRPARRPPAPHRRARDRARADRQPARRGARSGAAAPCSASTSRVRDGGDRIRAPARRRARPRPLRPRRAGRGRRRTASSARCSARARPVRLDVGGDGSWTRWTGAARLDVSGRRTADLRLAHGRRAASACAAGRRRRPSCAASSSG